MAKWFLSMAAAGMDVILVGPVPTPAIAMLVQSLRADLGGQQHGSPDGTRLPLV